MNWGKASFYLICFAAGLILGLNLGTNTCPRTITTPHVARAIDTVYKTTTVTVKGSDRYVIDSVFRVRLIHDTVPCVSEPGPAPSMPFALPPVLQQAAPAIVAAFVPREPVQFMEVYGHFGHNFLGGGYSGGLELDMNLEQIHLAPVTLYGDAGYDQGIHLTIGARGKLWGAM